MATQHLQELFAKGHDVHGEKSHEKEKEVKKREEKEMKESKEAECVRYKSKWASGGHFYIICHYGMVEKWKADKSIPLTEVVQRFEIFDGSSKHGGYNVGSPHRANNGEIE
jgi:hypothetical protein